ncbi:uroporphyrinogen-III synthase [Thermaurantiacus sp.]
MPPSEPPRLVLTRPEPESGALARAARRAGFATLRAPLLSIEPVAALPFEGAFDALLLTSARAAGFARAFLGPRACGCPAFAVGPETARAARAAGFRVMAQGSAGASAILAEAAAQGVRHLLHLCGADRAPAIVPEGLAVTERILYRAVAAASLPERVRADLAGDRVFATLLFSPRTARIFGDLVDRSGLDRARLRIVALSAAVAEAAGSGWRAFASASRPTADACLASARALWQAETERWTD